MSYHMIYYHIILHYITLHYITSYHIIFYCIVLYYITFSHIISYWGSQTSGPTLLPGGQRRRASATRTVGGGKSERRGSELHK